MQGTISTTFGPILKGLSQAPSFMCLHSFRPQKPALGIIRSSERYVFRKRTRAPGGDSDRANATTPGIVELSKKYSLRGFESPFGKGNLRRLNHLLCSFRS